MSNPSVLEENPHIAGQRHPDKITTAFCFYYRLNMSDVCFYILEMEFINI